MIDERKVCLMKAVERVADEVFGVERRPAMSLGGYVCRTSVHDGSGSDRRLPRHEAQRSRTFIPIGA